MAQISYHYNDVEYGENYTCYFGVPKAGTNVLADASDWTSPGKGRISKDGATIADTGNNPTHLGNGAWQLSLGATETSANNIIIVFSKTAQIDDVVLCLSTRQRRWALERSCVHNS